MKDYIKPPWDEDQTPLYHLVQMIFSVVYMAPGIALIFLPCYIFQTYDTPESWDWIIDPPEKWEWILKPLLFMIMISPIFLAAACLYKGKQHAHWLMTRKNKHNQRIDLTRGDAG